MAMAGAEVIKIEPPHGDMSRRRARDGDYPFRALNGCKRGIVLNLKTERGQELLLELSRTADVLVENFAPAVMPRLGLGAGGLPQGESPPDLRVGLGLRQYRALRRQARARPDDPGDERHDEHDRREGRTATQGRRAGRGLHVRRSSLWRDRDGALRARAHRPRPCHRGLDAGGALRAAASCGGPCVRERHAPERTGNRHVADSLRSVRHVRGRRRLGDRSCAPPTTIG